MLINKIAKKFSDYPVFTYRDVKIYLNNEISDNSLRGLISYMKKRGDLYIIRKGFYSFKKDSIISGYLFDPFYYGMDFAMTCREIWDQLVQPCIITVKRVKKNKINLFSDKNFFVEVHHIPIKYFFGYSLIVYNERIIPVSDAEKILIDLVYFRKKISKNAYILLCKKINKKKLMAYLMEYDQHTKKTVINLYSKYIKEKPSSY